MACLLQVDFPLDGPWGGEMAEAFRELAQSINRENGFLWKIWTEDAAGKRAGGIYLFDDKENARAYLDMHSKRLQSFGINEVRGMVFDINTDLSHLNRAPL